MDLVVADASPLIGLDRAGALHLLPGVFDRLAAPPAVVAEFGRRPPWLAEVAVANRAQVDVLMDLRFGPGEAEGLTVALERAGTSLLLDEKRARAFAKRHGLAIVGTAGVVLRAKGRGLIPAVRPVLDALKQSGFRLSDGLYAAVVAQAGEAD
ncbi:DUF3368 domain-containing protein [Rubrivirga sp.]|uniref:DUF3368 domain-containing protein n=1 Tax=Rubrivirga sp. TaxID=1885344 RepID=UPI003B52A3BA